MSSTCEQHDCAHPHVATAIHRHSPSNWKNCVHVHRTMGETKCFWKIKPYVEQHTYLFDVLWTLSPYKPLVLLYDCLHTMYVRPFDPCRINIPQWPFIKVIDWKLRPQSSSAPPRPRQPSSWQPRACPQAWRLIGTHAGYRIPSCPCPPARSDVWASNCLWCLNTGTNKMFRRNTT